MILARRSFPVYFFGGKYLQKNEVELQRKTASHLPPGLSKSSLRKIIYISRISIAFSLTQCENTSSDNMRNGAMEEMKWGVAWGAPKAPIALGWGIGLLKIGLKILFTTKASLIAVLLPQGKVIMIFRLYPDLWYSKGSRSPWIIESLLPLLGMAA